MGQDRTHTKSDTMVAYEYDMRLKKIETEAAKKMTSCFKCSKPDRIDTVLDQSIDRHYTNTSIEYVHDFTYNCSILDLKDRPHVLNCHSGDKEYTKKCSTCKYAGKQIITEYVGDVDQKKPVVEKHTLYKCKKHPKKGHYYKATYSCDKYEKG